MEKSKAGKAIAGVSIALSLVLTSCGSSGSEAALDLVEMDDAEPTILVDESEGLSSLDEQSGPEDLVGDAEIQSLSIDELTVANITAREARRTSGPSAGRPEVESWVSSFPLSMERSSSLLLGEIKSTLPAQCLQWAYFDGAGVPESWVNDPSFLGVAYSMPVFPDASTIEQLKDQVVPSTQALLLETGVPQQLVNNARNRVPECESYTVIFRSGTSRPNDVLADLSSNFSAAEWRVSGDALIQVTQAQTDGAGIIFALSSFEAIGSVLFKCSVSGFKKGINRAAKLCNQKADALAELQNLERAPVDLLSDEEISPTELPLVPFEPSVS